MSTIRQVAKTAGVSIATVSRVINNSSNVTDPVREKVLQAVNRCGYVPNVSRRSTSFLALVYAGPFSLGSPYDAALIEGMVQASASTQFDLVVLNPMRDKRADESYTQFFLRKGVRGVILRSTVPGRPTCEQIAAEGFPTIVVGDHFEHPGLRFVYADSTAASCQAVEHLIGLGHRDIALASNDQEDGDHVDRWSAYYRTLETHGLQPDAGLTFRVPARRSDGAQLMRNLMSTRRPPTAVYITDPPLAVGLINEARQLGVQIPRDLSVVGFDDKDVRNYVYPRMTAVCQDARQLGYQAFVELARTSEEPESQEAAQNRICPAWLEINSSTGKPPTDRFRLLPDGTRLPVGDA